jgi:hypothetical protein
MSALSDLARRTVAWHRPMMYFAALMAVMAVFTAAGILFDGRTLLGDPVWLKPFKFALSIGMYCLTWSWIVSLLPRARRLAWWVSTVVVAGLGFEWVLLMTQAIRGHQLHFNFSNDFDTMITRVMGFAALAIFGGSIALALILVFTRISDPADKWALRWGALLSVAGMAVGPLMTMPTPTQKIALGDKSTFDGIIGAHSVGVPDGGPGMALTGWSSTGGDLRIAHLVGLHALQVIPLFLLLLGVLATRYPVLRSRIIRTRLVSIASAGYAGLLALVLWQALLGQSLIHPDGLTWAAFGLLVAVVVAAGCLALRVRVAGASAERERDLVGDGLRP